MSGGRRGGRGPMCLAEPRGTLVCGLAILALAGAARPTPAQEHAPVFERLGGSWVGEGTLMGRAAVFTLEWRVESAVASLAFTNAFRNEDGSRTPVLSAAAAYRTTPAAPRAVWLDSRGVRVEITWRADASTLVSTWTAPTEEGRTTYRLVSDAELEVIDEVRSAEGLREFGRARYRRAEGG